MQLSSSVADICPQRPGAEATKHGMPLSGNSVFLSLVSLALSELTGWATGIGNDPESAGNAAVPPASLHGAGPVQAGTVLGRALAASEALVPGRPAETGGTFQAQPVQDAGTASTVVLRRSPEVSLVLGLHTAGDRAASLTEAVAGKPVGAAVQQGHFDARAAESEPDEGQVAVGPAAETYAGRTVEVIPSQEPAVAPAPRVPAVNSQAPREASATIGPDFAARSPAANDGVAGVPVGHTTNLSRAASLAGKPVRTPDEPGSVQVTVHETAGEQCPELRPATRLTAQAAESSSEENPVSTRRVGTHVEVPAPQPVTDRRVALQGGIAAAAAGQDHASSEATRAAPERLSLRVARTISDTLLQESLKKLPRSVELRMDPPELGKVTVLLSQRGQDVTVKFLAGTGEGQRMLSGALSDLQRALTEKGLVLTGFSVDPESRDQANRESRRDAGRSGTRRYPRAAEVSAAMGQSGRAGEGLFDRLA